MEIITYDLLLNTRYSGCRQQIQLYKGEVNARRFRIEMCHGTEPIVLDPLTCIAIIRGVKADKTVLFNTATVTEKGKVEYTLGSQDTAAVGETWYEVEIISKDDSDTKGRLMYSAQFKAVVSDTVADDGKITSSDEFGLLTDTIMENKQWKDDMDKYLIEKNTEINNWMKEESEIIDNRTLLFSDVIIFTDSDNTTPDPIHNNVYGDKIEFNGQWFEKDCDGIIVENNAQSNLCIIMTRNKDGEESASAPITEKTIIYFNEDVVEYKIYIYGIFNVSADVSKFNFYKIVEFPGAIKELKDNIADIDARTKIATSSDVWEMSDSLVPMYLLTAMIGSSEMMEHLKKATASKYGVMRFAEGSETSLGIEDAAATPYELKYILAETGSWADEQMSDESKGIVQNKVIKQYVDNICKSKATVFELENGDEPTSRLDDYPGAKPGDLCINKNYKAWICLYAEAGVIMWIELLTSLGSYLWDRFYNKVQIDNKLESKADKTYVDSAINAVNQFKISIVTEFPTENIDTHTIYFKPKTDTDIDDNYDEWIYLNENWEHIGNTVIDLSDYVKKTRKIAGFALDSDITGYDLINAIKDYSPFLIGVQNALKTSYAWEAILSDESKEFAKAVQSIGGALDSLETVNKSSYVGALNELVSILAQKADKEDWELFNTYTANGETGGFELTTVSEIKAKEVMIIGRELTFSGAANMNFGFRTSANPYSSGHRQLVFANGLTADNTYQIQGVIKRIGTDEILVTIELWAEKSVATSNVLKRQHLFKNADLFENKNIVHLSTTLSSGTSINTGTIDTYVRGVF